MLKYNVIIIGAGPSGLMLANQLKDSNLNVLIVEKRDTINKLDNNIFATFRDTIEKFDLENSIINDLPRIQFYGPSSSVKFSFEEKPLAVIDLDKWVKNLKLNCDVKINCEIIACKKSETGVIIKDSKNNEFFGKIVVDCSGNSQIVSDSMKYDKSSIYYVCYGLIVENCEIPDFEEGSLNADFKYTNAGGWLYPFSKTKCQVGIGDFLPYKSDYKVDIKERTLDMIKNFEPYKSWLKNGKVVSEVYKKAPMIMPHQHMIQNNLILVGDAGGQTTPFLGEGIRPAFEMADISARVIQEAFKKNDFSRDTLKEIEKEWMKLFGNSYVWSIIIRHIWAHEFTNDDINDLISNLQNLSREKFYDFLRSDIHLDLLYDIIDFKINEDVIVNFFKIHISHFNLFKEKEKILEIPSLPKNKVK